jgi:hypothetical protein
MWPNERRGYSLKDLFPPRFDQNVDPPTGSWRARSMRADVNEIMEGCASADSGRSRPGFRHDAARHSDLKPPSVPR